MSRLYMLVATAILGAAALGWVWWLWQDRADVKADLAKVTVQLEVSRLTIADGERALEALEATNRRIEASTKKFRTIRDAIPEGGEDASLADPVILGAVCRLYPQTGGCPPDPAGGPFPP